jgi:hypothetical protein
MDTLSPQRLEQLAAQLASKPDAAIREAIKGFAIDDRLALKLAIDLARTTRGLTAQAEETPSSRHVFEQDGSYHLRRLGVTGPLSLPDLEARMTAAGLPPEIRVACKVEAEQRKWLPPSLGHRLAATDDAPPLSLEMNTLFHRVGLDPDHSYSQAELDAVFEGSDLAVHERMAIRGELALRHRLRASGGKARDDWHQKAEALRDRLSRLQQLVRG